MKKLLIVTVILFVCFSVIADEPDFGAILRRIDSMVNFEDSDLSCVYTIVSEKPGEDDSVFKVRMFRRDREDKFLVLVLKPDTYRGEGYLRIKDNMWLYDPENRKFMHMSQKESFGSHEVKNSDWKAPAYAENYDVEVSSEGKLGRYDVYILELEANNNEVTYPRKKLWIRKDNYMVLKVEDYSLSGRLLRTAYYPKYIRLGDRFIASKTLLIDELKNGERSQMTIHDASLTALPDSVFTKSYVERVNM